ncbi:hypothetical protein [Actinoalloteichus hymeniacidonis]|uniref:Uncharacterized protein n=1 Tax=Actinoalloteichus hymeniacidonis TaxID=340345 RepID=A0AAC9HP62_9PSEU|nr:hypothetical protein [Actinoalloteichus hymeniacidonis]AOS62421.1 hypothetical protein TL08_08020 [Actinoalloteichus hymeniacidonis]MBB5909548.1 hypothetical protein [Actinoalloteichus hymeniacidonis]
MLQQWQRRRAAKRLKAGTGRPLKRFRWWQTFLSRALLHLQLTEDDGREIVYSIDVRHGGSGENGEVIAHLYRDGLHHAESKVPAIFPIEGGEIQVATTQFGVKRCHYVTDYGVEHQLTPDAKSPEGRRARLERNHPTLSGFIGIVSVILLVAGLGLNLVQIIEPISEIPPIAENLGTFESPIRLPLWLNIALGFGAALGSTERALRMRYHWLLDGGGN